MASDNISTRILSVVVPLSFEYIGSGMSDCIHLFGLPLSSIHTLLTYMRMHSGINITNNGSTEETLRSLSVMTLSHYVAQDMITHGRECMGLLVDQLRGFYV